MRTALLAAVSADILGGRPGGAAKRVRPPVRKTVPGPPGRGPATAPQGTAGAGGRQERLLVIDNAEDAESVRPFLPRGTPTGCRTLITSRFSDWPAAEGIRAITLDVLAPAPSREFLLARTNRTAEGAERTACDAQARALGYLPLALEQAAAYIAAPGAGVDFAG